MTPDTTFSSPFVQRKTSNASVAAPKNAQQPVASPVAAASAEDKASNSAENNAANNAQTRGGNRRFAIGRLVPNAAPPEEVIARALQKRLGSAPNGSNGTNGSNGAPDPAPGMESQTADETTSALSGEQVGEQLESVAEGIGQLFDVLAAMHEQEQGRQKAFDTLYSEMSDYKDDFFARRLRPMARGLLFLLDSMEEYNRELEEGRELEIPLEYEGTRAHVDHFVGQLRDVLEMADLEQLSHSGSEFDPKTQRAVEVVPVETEQDGQVVRVVRSGWTLGTLPLRPADVVVGKKS